MHILRLLPILALLAACDYRGEEVVPEPVPANAEVVAPTTGSFNLRNGEIREEMLAEFDKAGVHYWINDDNSIGYNLVDGEVIDEIGNSVIREYITRN